MQCHKFSLDVSSLILTTSAFVKKGKVKDEKSKKNRETNGGQIKELRFPQRYYFACACFDHQKFHLVEIEKESKKKTFLSPKVIGDQNISSSEHVKSTTSVF